METNFAPVSPEHINFLKDALYTHAIQVESFCVAECRRVRSDIENENHKASAPLKGRKLVKQLEGLIKSARNSDCLLRAVNLEQLEARTERLLELLDSTPVAEANADVA